jgi:hypothetical protein
MCAGATRLCSGAGDRIRDYWCGTVGAAFKVMSWCFRAILSHWAETPEEVSEGPWSKSDSKQRSIDVAAVGMDVAAAPSVTESRLLPQPKLEPRLGHSSPKGSCRCWQSSRDSRVPASMSCPLRVTPCEPASVNPRGGGQYCPGRPGRGSGSPVGSGNGPNIGPSRAICACILWFID